MFEYFREVVWKNSVWFVSFLSAGLLNTWVTRATKDQKPLRVKRDCVVVGHVVHYFQSQDSDGDWLVCYMEITETEKKKKTAEKSAQTKSTKWQPISYDALSRPGWIPIIIS